MTIAVCDECSAETAGSAVRWPRRAPEEESCLP
jgi:hypothetical protein